MFIKSLMSIFLVSGMLLNVSTAGWVKCEADWPSESLEKCQYEGEEFRPRSFGSRVARSLLLSRTTFTFFGDDIDLDEELPNKNNTTSILASGSRSEGSKDDVSYTKRDPTEEPVPTKEPVPTQEPVPTEEPAPTEKPAPTRDPISTEQPTPTKEPVPSKEPLPSKEPTPTKEPVPSKEPAAPKEPVWPNKWTTRPCCQLTCACFKYISGLGGKSVKQGSKEWNKARCCYEKMRNDPKCANPPPLQGLTPIEPPWCLN